MNQDTIAAISTGMTNSGIGIVRISGSEALEIADRVYKGKETITEVPTHTIHYGHVMDGDETVDEVLVMVMRGPRTFTGEDTVEINCHGGTYVVSRVLETVLKAGARPAEPGEFTKRAFLNGKMDLSQAEAVIDVITSENEYALQSSPPTRAAAAPSRRRSGHAAAPRWPPARAAGRRRCPLSP